MSTYLLAFAIGDFVESNYTSKSGVVNRAIVVRNQRPFIKNSAKYGALCVDAMESLVKVRLPLQKLDHLDSIGASSGAMENFGLIIYNHAVPEGFGYTLHENTYKRRVMCHETAHQWFGNLVTADHWGWEFLHESFATFFETNAMFNTEAGYLAQLAEPARISNAVQTYASANHPIVDERARFDSITYAVGGALLISVQHALGRGAFYEGLRVYQVENKFGVAGLDTLIGSFVKAKGTDKLCGPLTITEYLKDYFLRAGSPEVSITIEDGKYVLKQVPQRDGRTWNVPLFVLDLTANKEYVLWLRKDGSICSADNFQLQADGEYFFNNEGKGFATYKIQGEIWSKLAKSPSIYKLSSLNLDILLTQLLGSFKPEEVASIVYDIIEKKEGKVDYFLMGYLAREKELERKAVQIVSDNFDYIPTPQNRLLGMAFLDEAVKLNITSVVEKTSQWFEQFKRDCGPEKDVAGCTEMTPEWRRAVYRQGHKTKEGQEFIRNYANRIANHKWERWMRSEYDRTQSL